MTVEQTRAQLEQAKGELEAAIGLLGKANEIYGEAAAAVLACGDGSAHSEPHSASGGLRQAVTGAESAVAYSQATIDTIDTYSSQI